MSSSVEETFNIVTRLHHIFPQEFFTDPVLTDLFVSMKAQTGFDKESISNHINLIRDAKSQSASNPNGEQLKNVLVERIREQISLDDLEQGAIVRGVDVMNATGGLSPSHHSSNHQAYSNFLKVELTKVSLMPTGSEDQKKSQIDAFKKLYSFADDVSKGASFVGIDENCNKKLFVPGVQDATYADMQKMFNYWNTAYESRLDVTSRYSGMFEDVDDLINKGTDSFGPTFVNVSTGGTNPPVILDASQSENNIDATKIQYIKKIEALHASGAINEDGDVVIACWDFLDSRLTAGYTKGLTYGDLHANIDARLLSLAA